jgi:hypothetical protein
MLQSFYALRDEFLDELDLATPDSSLLHAGARRIKKPGALKWSQRLQEIQANKQKKIRGTEDDYDRWLAELYAEGRLKEAERAGTGAVGTAAKAPTDAQRGSTAAKV